MVYIAPGFTAPTIPEDEMYEGKDFDPNYFLKMILHAKSSEIAEGEFVPTRAWHGIVPAHVPAHVGFGECANRPWIHFLLTEFQDMMEEMPSTDEFVAAVARVHTSGTSPNGKFGFSVPTLSGALEHDNTWCDSWEEWFTKSIKAIMQLETQAQGYDEELAQLNEQVLAKVVPHLLLAFRNKPSPYPLLSHIAHTFFKKP
ncbi:hypothetical protein F4778DRAFT_786724 [Xylariomycetidae sp. FL2044]|nr:hypothetical protein F4778DRAFT_786724 [Xylariomycetidae sp. FL2044]